MDLSLQMVKRTIQNKKSRSDLKEQFGIVVMLDALGVSGYTKDQCKEFLKTEKSLIAQIDTLHKKFGGKSNFFKESTVITFGDTIVICWPLDIRKESWPFFKVFTAVALELREIICAGIEKGILFRGCISVGDYIIEKNTILGPAIFDAHDWYEAADWFGVIISPKTKLWLDVVYGAAKRSKERSLAMFEKNIVYYNVPLVPRERDHPKKEFFTVAWPRKYWDIPESQNEIFQKAGLPFEHKEFFEAPPEIISRMLFDIHVPKNAETKVKNSLAFFDWYGKEYPRLKSKP
jgi:hypothetical protein